MTTIFTTVCAIWIVLCFGICLAAALIIQGGRGDQRDDEWN